MESMNASLRMKSGIVLSTFSLVCAEYAYAAGGHGKGSISDLFFPWINFIVYVGILFFVLRKPLAALWSARRSAILEAVEASKRANDEARVIYSAAQERARSLPSVIQSLKEKLGGEAVAEAQLLQQDAEGRAAKIVQSAKDTLAGEQKAFQVEMRRQFVDEVMQRAEAKLRNEVNEGRDQQLRQSSLKHIKALLN